MKMEEINQGSRIGTMIKPGESSMTIKTQGKKIFEIIRSIGNKMMDFELLLAGANLTRGRIPFDGKYPITREFISLLPTIAFSKAAETIEFGSICVEWLTTVVTKSDLSAFVSDALGIHTIPFQTIITVNGGILGSLIGTLDTQLKCLASLIAFGLSLSSTFAARFTCLISFGASSSAGCTSTLMIIDDTNDNVTFDTDFIRRGIIRLKTSIGLYNLLSGLFIFQPFSTHFKTLLAEYSSMVLKCSQVEQGAETRKASLTLDPRVHARTVMLGA